MMIRENVMKIRSALEAAAISAGRNPGEITLCAATKMNDAQRVREAIAAGVVRGLVYEVKGYMRQLKEQKIAFKTYVTGGHAPYILNAMKHRDVVGEPHLVLIGLNRILSGV
jgi:pantothenate kinase type III